MDAVDRMRAARIEPSALADFFQRLARKGGELPDMLAWLGTHPELESRINDVRQRAELRGEQETKEFTIDWEEVRRHAGRDPDQPD
jgi:predicted Zn-dependent protease